MKTGVSRSVKVETRPSHEDSPHQPMAVKIRGCLSRNLLLLFTLLGIAIGLSLGIALRRVNPSDDAIMWLGMPGEMFLRGLRMMIVPLISSNIIVVIASMNFKLQGRMATIAFTYIVITNFLGTSLGACMAVAIQPGNRIGGQLLNYYRELNTKLTLSDIFADLIRNILPSNILQSTMYTVATSYQPVSGASASPNVSKNSTDLRPATKRVLQLSEGTNILGLVTISIIFGLACSKAGAKARPFLDFFSSLCQISVIILRVLIWFLPVGVGSLVCTAILSVDQLEQTLASLGLFVASSLTANIIHQVVLLNLIFVIFTRRNPFPYFIQFLKGWLTGFATTSSMAALPTLFECSDRCGISHKVSRCVLPICVATNSDGSASFIALCCFFLAQLQGIPISISTGIVIVLLTGINVMALPAIPSSSLVAVVIICTSVDIPVNAIALIFTTEFILDRFRTTSNIISHAYCCAVVDKFCKTQIEDQAETEFLETTSF